MLREFGIVLGDASVYQEEANRYKARGFGRRLRTRNGLLLKASPV